MTTGWGCAWDDQAHPDDASYRRRAHSGWGPDDRQADPEDAQLLVDDGRAYDDLDLDAEPWSPRRAPRRTHTGEHEDLAALVGVTRQG